MPRKGENIYRRKDGRWEGRYIKGRADGKIRYGYVFAKTYRETKQKLEEAKRYGREENHVPADELFSSVAREWYQAGKPQWKQSSAVKYNNILNSYLLPDFSERKISQITRDEVMLFGSRLLSDGGAKRNGLSPKTVSDTLSVMKNILEYASQIKGLCAADMRGISVKQSQKSMRILSLTEQQRLSRYLCQALTPCNLGILLCLYTGLRIGEICALKWGDISFGERYIFVHQTMQRLQVKEEGGAKTTIVVSAPKSDCSARRIPIPEGIFGLLEESKKQKEAYVLTGMEHVFVEPRTMQNRFKAAVKSCQISDANFHSLRHTFATRCVELGFDIKSLSEILGHASVNITLNRYVHPSMEQKQKNMDRLSELFSVG